MNEENNSSRGLVLKRTRGREHDALRKQEMAKEVKGHSEKSGSLKANVMSFTLLTPVYPEHTVKKSSTFLERIEVCCLLFSIHIARVTRFIFKRCVCNDLMSFVFIVPHNKLGKVRFGGDLFSFLSTLPDMQDPNFPTRDETCAPCSGSSLNHWTTREIPERVLLFSFFK